MSFKTTVEQNIKVELILTQVLSFVAHEVETTGGNLYTL